MTTAAGSLMNTSGDLTSSFGNSGTASATLVSTATPPTFAKAFAPSTVAVGGTSTLTFTIDNSTGAIAATSLAFSDTFPAGMEVAATPSASTTCTGGTITATPGAGSASYSGGTVNAGGSCTVQVDVVTTAVGNLVNTSGALTSSLGNSGTAADTLTVTATALGFSIAFSPTSIAIGGASTLTFTIDNSANGAAATSLDFSDALPPGVLVAATPNAATTCTGGTITATAGATTISYTGGSVGANATCTVSADLVGTSVGNLVNTTGDLTSSFGNSGTAADTLTVTASALGFSIAFSPTSIAIGGTSTLTFTIDNGANGAAATSLDFSDTLPAGVQVATPPNAATTCTGGTLTAAAGASTIGYTNGTVSANGSCTVMVDVLATSAGNLVNTTSVLTSSFGVSAAAAVDTLSVTASALGFTMAFAPSTIAVDTLTTFTVTIDNTLNAADATAMNWTQTLPAGLEVAPIPNVATDCLGGTANVLAGATSQSLLAATAPSGSTCTVSFSVLALAPRTFLVASALTSSFGDSGTASATLTVGPSEAEVVRQTKTAVRKFMHRRADLITVEEPNLTERLAAIGPRFPVDAQAIYTPEGAVLSFSTSLSQMHGSIAAFNAAYSNEADALRTLGYSDAPGASTPAPFDVWTEGTVNSYRDEETGEQHGHFGIVFLGAEWRARPNLALGVLGQYDSTRESDDTTGIAARGTGWMVGPYAAGKLSDTRFFQIRGAYGRSTNTITPFGTYSDDFDTTRWLVNGKIEQRLAFGAWQFRPSAGMIYFSDAQHEYVDSNGYTISSQTVALGRLMFGPEVGYQGTFGDGLTIEPTLGVTGIWDFVSEHEDGNGITPSDDIRARLFAGLAVAGGSGLRLNISAYYDGLGDRTFAAYGGKAKLVMPLGGK